MLLRGFNLQQMFISFLMLVSIVPVHECAHAWVADKLGDSTGRYQGRMTVNPLAHLDLFGTISFLLVGFGWGKPVPVYRYNLRKPKRDMALVALAGPVSNVLLSIALTIVYDILASVLGRLGLINNATYVILWIISSLAATSVYWAIFNLIPVPPLDGSRLLEYLLPAKYYVKIEQYQQIIYIVMIVLLFTGILSGPIAFLSGFVLKFINFITIPVRLLLGVIF